MVIQLIETALKPYMIPANSHFISTSTVGTVPKILIGCLHRSCVWLLLVGSISGIETNPANCCTWSPTRGRWGAGERCVLSEKLFRRRWLAVERDVGLIPRPPPQTLSPAGFQQIICNIPALVGVIKNYLWLVFFQRLSVPGRARLLRMGRRLHLLFSEPTLPARALPVIVLVNIPRQWW